jgi:hypothetical protein
LRLGFCAASIFWRRAPIAGADAIFMPITALRAQLCFTCSAFVLLAKPLLYSLTLSQILALHEFFAWQAFGRLMYNARLNFPPFH